MRNISTIVLHALVAKRSHQFLCSFNTLRTTCNKLFFLLLFYFAMELEIYIKKYWFDFLYGLDVIYDIQST
jgi:hypothetical protein